MPDATPVFNNISLAILDGNYSQVLSKWFPVVQSEKNAVSCYNHTWEEKVMHNDYI